MHNAVVFNIRGPIWRLKERHGLEIATTTNPRQPAQPPDRTRITRREFH